MSRGSSQKCTGTSLALSWGGIHLVSRKDLCSLLCPTWGTEHVAEQMQCPWATKAQPAPGLAQKEQEDCSRRAVNEGILSISDLLVVSIAVDFCVVDFLETRAA